MTMDTDIYRRYLLGQLDEAERTALEDRLFASDDALTPDLQAAEDDLVDDYVRGRLDSEERARFEATLERVPSRRRKVDFASALGRVPVPTGHGRPWTRARSVSLAIAASLVLVAWGALWMRGGRPPAEPQASVPSRAVPAASTTARPPATVRLVLLAGALRGSSASPFVHIDATTGTVELDAFVDIEGPVPARGRARIARASGGEVWAEDVRLAQDADGVHARLRVPASTLAADDYLVTLTGDQAAGELASYALRVAR